MKNGNYVSVHLYENAINQLNGFDILCAKLTKENQLMYEYIKELESIVKDYCPTFRRNACLSYNKLNNFYFDESLQDRENYFDESVTDCENF